MAELAPRLVWSVSGLLRAVSDALAGRFAACTVQGELSGFSRAGSGHCYFSLKDADGAPGLVRCAMFRRASSLLAFAPEDGQRVEVRGRLALYEPRGELQLVVEAMRPAGAGALYEQFLRLKAKLEAEGLFDPARRRALPRHPRTIGIVTSTGGAVLHDVASVLARRAPHIRVVVYPSPVQGAQAATALVGALALANRRAEVDVLLLCRGGGSLEDLWSFNDERLVRAVAGSTVPVVAAIGHETDVTLVDFAADVRAATPSIAAELVAPARDELLRRLRELGERLARARRRSTDLQAQRLDRAAARLRRPAERLAAERLALQRLAQRLSQALPLAFAQRRAALQRAGQGLRHGAAVSQLGLRHRQQQLATRLGALDPRRVIERGYALVHGRDGHLVLAPEAIAPGPGSLRLTLAGGTAELDVAAVRPDDCEPNGERL